jgi:hypothetical protein
MRRPSRPVQLTAIGCALVLAYVLAKQYIIDADWVKDWWAR